MIFSVAVRQGIVRQLRTSIDRAVEALNHQSGDQVKVFLTLPNGKAVTIYGSRMAVVNCILTDAKPVDPFMYSTLRSVGWAAFGVHVVTLGMADLLNQILCVIILVCSTVLVARHAGDELYTIGAKLFLEVRHGDPSLGRAAAYARLALTETEEDLMVHWSLLPQRCNHFWWDRYRIKQTYYVRQADHTVPQRMVAPRAIELQQRHQRRPRQAHSLPMSRLPRRVTSSSRPLHLRPAGSVSYSADVVGNPLPT